MYTQANSLTPVVKNLVIANVLMFIAQNYFDYIGKPIEPFLALWSIDTGNFKVWQLITHLFMHENFIHILYNMIGLWMFGPILESVWGPKRFLQFYFICGLAAALAMMLLQSHFESIGASGAVMGILAGFAYLFPNQTLYMMFIPIPIKAKYAITGLILYDIFGQFSNRGGDGIGHFAHLGGALAGLIMVFIWNRTNRKTFY